MKGRAFGVLAIPAMVLLPSLVGCQEGAPPGERGAPPVPRPKASLPEPREPAARTLPAEDAAARRAAAEEDAAHSALRAGNAQEAVRHFFAAIAARQAGGQVRWEVSNRNFAGLALRRLLDAEAARRQFVLAERLAAADLFVSGQAAAINNLGLLEQDAGNFAQALVLYRRALRLLAPIGSPRLAGDVALYRENLARLLILDGELDEAERLLLPVSGAPPTAAGKAELAWLHLLRQRPGKALEALDVALGLRPEPSTACIVHDRRGTALERLGRVAEAHAAYAASLVLSRGRAPDSTSAATFTSLCRLEVLHPAAVPDSGGRLCADAAGRAARPGVPAATLASAHYWRALDLRRRGRLRQAQQSAERAAALVAALRSDVSRPERRARFLEERGDYFSLAIDLAMEIHRRDPELGFDRIALAESERWRARTLAEEIAARRGGEALQQELAAARRRLRDKETARGFLAREGLAAASVEVEIEQAEARVAALEADLRRRRPRSAELAEASFDLAALHRQLDRQTTVFDLVLGEKKSFLWRIGKAELSSFELPAAGALEKQARLYLELISDPRRTARRASALKAGSELAEMLFGKRLERLAGSGRRLVLVGDGALAAFPLGALPMPSSTPGEPSFLIEEKEVVALPSLGLLTALRRPRPADQRPSGALAALGDPWYEAASWRGRLQLQPVPADEARQRLGKAAPFAVARLPFAAQEMERIAARLAGRRCGLLRIAGPDATRARALGKDLGHYAVIHFSAHGELDPLRPEHSSVVLSELDREGRRRDGRLASPELADLLWRAELVVASSCDSAGGKPLRFESVAGLASGFFYAGASRSLVSLWQVEGAATAELMDFFYAALLEQGLPPGEALRAAQHRMLAEARAIGSPWRAPYFWGGFALFGDWQAFSLP